MSDNSTNFDWALVPVEDPEDQLKEWGVAPNGSVSEISPGIIQTYEDIPAVALVLSIPFNILGMILQVFIITYERFEMDSMKRGLKNQLISSQILWTFLLSLTLTFRFIFTLCSIKSLIGFQIFLEYLRMSCMMVAVLTGIEISLFEFYCKFVLKRVPECNHDFLAMWLSVVNLILGLFLGFIQLYGRIGFSFTGDNTLESQQPR